ncbi:hypothetical protein THRCLA_23415 [Thraustotheca clavata]|uniref:Uncharacterized protein n=1 Tax=Thraustotheca clavata TaxID=74557 RepID=A0A1V9Y5Z5_9STRA|nr:hypothetical protein THRCLA_23415 [Thraustotheca clavata]
MTGVLLLVSILVCYSIISTKGYVEGLNMFEINRVGGIVWVGRPFLALRGIIAIFLLSTAKLEMVRVKSVYYFVTRASNWFTVLLACGEMGWLVYILNDLFSVFTQQYTMGYSTKSGIVIWFVSGVLSLLSPIEHSAVLNRVCRIEIIDYQAVCASGTIYIGNFQRCCTLIGLAICVVVLCYFIERIQNPQQKCDSRYSLLLSSPGRYMFEKKSWEVDNIYYLDKASAVISGILSLQLRKQLFIFDIKMWRFYTIDLSQYPSPQDTPLSSHFVLC